MKHTLMTPQEVAVTLKVHPTTVKRWIRRGTIPFVLLPSHSNKKDFYRIPSATVEAILNGRVEGI